MEEDRSFGHAEGMSGEIPTEQLRKKLLETKGELVEANGRDYYFSCGIWLSDPAILDKSLWLGENVLRQILTQLRIDLSQN